MILCTKKKQTLQHSHKINYRLTKPIFCYFHYLFLIITIHFKEFICIKPVKSLSTHSFGRLNISCILAGNGWHIFPQKKRRIAEISSENRMKTIDVCFKAKSSTLNFAHANTQKRIRTQEHTYTHTYVSSPEHYFGIILLYADDNVVIK